MIAKISHNVNFDAHNCVKEFIVNAANVCVYCALKMGYCSLSYLWVNGNQIQHCILHHCVCYTQLRVLECLPRDLALHSTVCLLTNSSTVENTTAK
jgi:hypothetical protein